MKAQHLIEALTGRRIFRNLKPLLAQGNEKDKPDSLVFVLKGPAAELLQLSLIHI